MLKIYVQIRGISYCVPLRSLNIIPSIIVQVGTFILTSADIAYGLMHTDVAIKRTYRLLLLVVPIGLRFKCRIRNIFF